MSVEEVGRIIGQRWRDLPKNELAKFQEMAKEDYTRYREEIAEFHEDELALMCMGYDFRGNTKSHDTAESSGQKYIPDEESKPSGNKDMAKTWQPTLIQADGDVSNLKSPVHISPKVAEVSHSNDDRKPPAMGHHLGETTQSQVHLPQANNIVTALSLLAQEAAKVSSIPPVPYTTTAPQLNTIGVASSSDPNTNWILQRVQQLVHEHQQQQRSCTLPSNTDQRISTALSNEICQQRAAIKQRHDALLLEYQTLQFKDSMLETVMSSLGQGSTASISGSTGNCARADPVSDTNRNLGQMLANINSGFATSEPMKMSALQAILQSSHSSIASAGKPQTGNINDLNQYLHLLQTPSLGMSPVQAMLARAAQGIPTASASLGNQINLLSQSHQHVCPDNLRLLAHILGSEGCVDSPTDTAKKENPKRL